MKSQPWTKPQESRCSFIGGSDARIIMGDDEAALFRLWREKRGELEPEDLSGDLLVQLGAVTEPLNRRWYEKDTGQVGHDVGTPPHTQRVRLPGLRRRTPGPPPFSSMNSTPAASRARRTARSLAAVIEVSASDNSARRIVATLKELSRARSSALQRIRERAARIWALVNARAAMLTLFLASAMFHIISFVSYLAA